MQTNNRLLDDLMQLATNAMGVAQGARDEAQNAARSLAERWLAENALVTREEFDAMAEMVRITREENAELKARIEAMEAMRTPENPTPEA